MIIRINFFHNNKQLGKCLDKMTVDHLHMCMHIVSEVSNVHAQVL